MILIPGNIAGCAIGMFRRQMMMWILGNREDCPVRSGNRFKLSADRLAGSFSMTGPEPHRTPAGYERMTVRSTHAKKTTQYPEPKSSRPPKQLEQDESGQPAEPHRATNSVNRVKTIKACGSAGEEINPFRRVRRPGEI